MPSRPAPRRVPARAPAVQTEPPLFYVTQPVAGDGVAKYVVAAFVISVVFHIFIAVYSGYIKVPALPISLQFPKSESMEGKTFEIQEVVEEKPSPVNNPQAPAANLPPQSAIPQAQDIQENTKLDSDGSTIDRALLASRPQVDIPAPTDPNMAVSPELTASTAFTTRDDAIIESHIARLPVGPTSSDSLPEFVAPPDAFAKRSGAASSPDPGGRGGIKSTASNPGEKVPTFADVSRSLKEPKPVVDPKLPEPVLLYLPSDVLFDFGSAKLREEAYPLLQQTASMISQYARAKVTISGHTDSFGSDGFNQRLSEQRAQVVENYLRSSLSSPVYTFSVTGYGKSRPLVSPTLTREEQQRNRRVEVVIQAIPQ
ncbi:hypothetical protein DB346_20135 [Verrucomicrobia bacterium LW23]|nr:hypothetical protein DB346_20135 [Verrucomicrobia bacterium LW23]